ncbi:hypothetical protein EI94DRAFT_1772066 [Lactarius quietus]|nr:hypothetical protein EI94DRAFT_1772066 [Lactarius quietus]
MSLSAEQAGFSRNPSGKTPPPAPSAAFAKRARELQGDGMIGRYRPPALRALASGGSPPNDVSPSTTITPTDSSSLPTNTYSSGYRRARAGTLPSNVSLAAQHPSAFPSTESFSEQLQLLPQPTLRHSTSVASTVASRLRSGSLTTLPSTGLSNPFGSSIFSSSWLASSGNNTSFSNNSSFPVLEERSMDHGADDFDLRNQAQAVIAGNLSNPPRMRATTVSHPYRRMSSAGVSLLPTPNAEDEEEVYEQQYSHPGLDTYNDSLASENYYRATKTLNQTDYLSANLVTSRPRAISVGTLDDPARITRRATVSVEQPVYDLASSFNGTNSAQLNQAGILKTDKSSTLRAGASPTVRFPVTEVSGSRAPSYLLTPNQPGRAVSPKSENPAQIQTPTRSLWIGNLDSSVTSEQLIHVFAPYGAIESLRLLPEKECGFVNFVDQADAVRAKEDVLNRLGGNIGMPNGQTVRIGFGKADSAPAAPGKGAGGTSSTGSSISTTGKNATSPSMSGMEAQLQSTPTRALWIGSIPSTTTPAAILSVFSPYGPIESARVLTHKNCGFINFERLDDAVRARKALNGRDVLGSDVGAIRIGFAKVPVKNGQENVPGQEEAPSFNVQGVREGSLYDSRGSTSLGGTVENYRSNLLLTFVNDGTPKPAGWSPTVTEQQMIMKELSGGAPDADADILALAGIHIFPKCSDFRPPTMYYTTIPLVSERPHNRRWDASKLRELRKRMDSNTILDEEIEQVAADFLDGEIVDLASDWLGNTVVQKLFEKCAFPARMAMLDRISPHLAMIGIHKNGTWAAQKIIECVQTPEEINLIAQHLRPYAPPLLLDQFGNYVIQCCLRFGQPANDSFLTLWRSMRACLESPNITISQQRRIATAIILNSIPLATNPNGALLLTWLLDTSAPRFTPHLSHLCTHKLASLTVLRIVNQKVEPEASSQVVEALFSSPNDHVLTDVLGDQVNGVAVVHKVLTSPFLDITKRAPYIESTKRVLIELKVIATQAYRRLVEEVGLPIPNFQASYPNGSTTPGAKGKFGSSSNSYGVPGLPSGYSTHDQNLASMMASLQMGGQNPHSGPPQPPQLSIDPGFNGQGAPQRSRSSNAVSAFSPSSDPFNPFALRSAETSSPRIGQQRRNASPPIPMSAIPYGAQSPVLNSAGAILGMGQPSYSGMAPQSVPPQVYQQYVYQMYQQNPPNMGAFHA